MNNLSNNLTTQIKKKNSFIEYLSSDDAKRAVEMLDGTELRGNIVRVQTQQQVVCHAIAIRDFAQND